MCGLTKNEDLEFWSSTIWSSTIQYEPKISQSEQLNNFKTNSTKHWKRRFRFPKRTTIWTMIKAVDRNDNFKNFFEIWTIKLKEGNH